MKGTLSFHPVDPAFFDVTIAPLVRGGKIDPDPFLARAVRLRLQCWRARRIPRALERILAAAAPPQPEPGARLWDKVRARLERLDYRPDEVTRRAVKAVDPELHVHGRPFFITAGSASKVAEFVDRYLETPSPQAADELAREQLASLDPDLARAVEPEDGPELSAEMHYRADLLAEMTRIHAMAGATPKKEETWDTALPSREPQAAEVAKDLPWRAVTLHSRIMPFWIARDVDGLETICGAAGVAPPDFLVPPLRLFGDACIAFPDLKAALTGEIQGPRGVGGFVAPGDVSRLLMFLNDSGARIIQVATRYGEGPDCTTLLRKIRECATYAERRGLGYLEACGITPPDLPDAENENGG